MAERIRVRGAAAELTDEQKARNQDLGFEDGIQVDVKHVIDVTAQARALGEEMTIELDDDDIIESRDADGWVSLTTVEDLRKRTSGDRSARADGAIDLIPALASGQVTRGGMDLKEVTAYAAKLPAHILEELDILDRLAGAAIDQASRLAMRAAAKKVVEWLERSVPDDKVGEETIGRPKHAGVYRVGGDLRIEPSRRLKNGETLDAGRNLVLLHGTFSSTEGGFAALGGKPEWQELVKEYAGVFALEHKTLSVNPVENALQLARCLPAEATLDLVSHSRGGLVGEFLSLAAANQLVPKLHKRSDRELQAEESALLEELVALLFDKKISVNRFVRVASPASGTILASERIDEVAGFLFNVVEKVPGVAGWIFTVIKSLALAFLHQRTRPDVIPGLEAMMPDSPFIRLLNASGSDDPQRGFDDRLGVIAGDVDRSRWFKWFAEKGADLFYGEEHDYVVDTLSMYQGAQRKRAWVSLHTGANVNHFTYFREADSRCKLRDWLTLDPEDSGFRRLDRRPAELPKAARKHRGAEDAPVVVIVPDLFGSSLRSPGGALVWPDPAYLVRNGLNGIGAEANLTVGEILDSTYGPLVERLSAQLRVEPFPYDWRQSLVAAGKALAGRIDQIALTTEGRRIHVLAHGAGGLAVRSALAAMDDPTERVGNIVLLGFPNHGSLRALQWATGRSDLIEKLGMLDPGVSELEIAELLRSYDSVLELLPADGKARKPDLWSGLGIKWAGAKRRLDATATDVASAWAVKPIAVAGYGYPTAARVEAPGSTLRYFGNDAGDGMVTANSAAVAERADYFVPAAHGDLPGHQGSLTGYAELVRDGTTSRLNAGPLDLDDEEHELPARRGRHLFPGAVDLERAALSGGLQRVQPPQPGLSIEVIHGDLRFADHPVMVGHYKGSALEGAEKALDRHLGGRLTNRDVLGLYPGDVGKAEIIFAEPGKRPPAAVVVGMGEIGSITRAKVTASVAEGAARAAIAHVERLQEEDSSTDGSETALVGIATVLIGNNGPYGLSIDNTVAAITAGVVGANRLLSHHALDRRIQIDRLQFVELFEDVAIETLHAVHRMLDEPDGAANTTTVFGSARVTALPYLRSIEGGKKGQPPPEYNRGDWRPIMVESVIRREENPHAEREAKTSELDASDVEASPDPNEAKAAAKAPGDVTRRLADESTAESNHQRDAESRRDLTFTSIGLAARAERLVHAWQRQLVEKVIAKVVREPDPDEQVYNTLYELLVPNYLKGVTSDADNILLVLDSAATRYPWEMLATRTATGDVLPIAARSGVVRRLISTGDFREPRRAVGTKALVIGDPPVGRGFARLPGARREAQQMVEVLTSHGYEVSSLIPESDRDHSLEIVNALFREEYRIVHIAAHGVYDEDPERSGVVIGPDAFLSPLSFRQMESVPPLVFLNCCHIGTVGTQYREFAASVSEQLIRDGVRAVVAAGWAVNDDAAGRFAQVFYDMMFDGRPFGEAVKAARVRVYHEHGSANNTWGAYQCYGDPGFKLVSRSMSAEAVDPIAPKELRDRLLEIEERASDTPHRQLGELDDEVKRLLRRAPREWLTSEVNDAAAAAYAEIGNFQEAINHYQLALQDDKTLAPVRSIEQLANLAGRRAARMADESAEGGVPATETKEFKDLIGRAEAYLDIVLALPGKPSRERLRLKAAHEKRLAQAQRSNLRLLRRHLERAREYYERAREAALPEVDPDTTINAALFDHLVFIAGGGEVKSPTTKVLQLVEDSKAEADRRSMSEPGFWNRVAAADARALLGVVNADLSSHVDDLVAGYTRAFEKLSTARERRSVIDHFRFLEVVLERLARRRDPELADVSRACGEIYERLTSEWG